MTTSQREALERELNTCEGQIREISELRPEYTLTQLLQGFRASRRDLETLKRYLRTLERHRQVSAEILQVDPAFQFCSSPPA